MRRVIVLKSLNLVNSINLGNNLVKLESDRFVSLAQLARVGGFHHRLVLRGIIFYIIIVFVLTLCFSGEMGLIIHSLAVS